MGNISSYFSNKQYTEEYIGKIAENLVDGNNQTPTRCNRTNSGHCFDPRSPTFDIDRTPIVVETKPDDGPEDPRSPSCGIVRTPVCPNFEPINLAMEKERNDLIQVLNFTDLDSLSISKNEEEGEEEAEEELIMKEEQEPNLAPVEETLDFSSFVITATSTPTRVPTKVSNKTKRPLSSNIVDENSFGKSSSPLNSGSAPLSRPRVPFGDVNRPSLASPRLHLQNKQRNIVRSEILQHQQRYVNKSD